MKWFILALQVLLVTQFVLCAKHRPVSKESVESIEDDSNEDSESNESGSNESGGVFDVVGKIKKVYNDVKKFANDQLKSRTHKSSKRNRNKNDNDKSASTETPNGDTTNKASTNPESQDNTNHFIDNILNAFGSMIIANKPSKPILLPNKSKKFSKSAFGLSVYGDANLTNTAITNGLETIHRIGDASFGTTKNKTHVHRKFSCSFQFKYVEVVSNFTIRFMDHGPDGYFVAASDYLQFNLELDTTSYKGQRKGGDIKLAKVALEEYKSFRFHVEEFASYKTRMLEIIVNPVVGKFFEKTIVREINSKVRELMEEVLAGQTSSPSLKQLFQMSLNYL